jgi:hypothetical protein
MNAFSNFDAGGGGSEGPWLQWSARGTLDGVIPAKSFFIRDADGKQVFGGFTGGGVVLDIDKMQTGWCHSDGVAGQAPDWKMNRTISEFATDPSTDGKDYKKGFKIRCAIGGGKTAAWDQAGAAAWNAFLALVPALQQGPAGKLPLVKMTGARFDQFKRGSTNVPILEVVQWVDRPDCLKEGVAAGIATAPAPQTAPAAATASAVPADAGF